jgi:hypothetical protein
MWGMQILKPMQFRKQDLLSLLGHIESNSSNLSSSKYFIGKLNLEFYDVFEMFLMWDGKGNDWWFFVKEMQCVLFEVGIEFEIFKWTSSSKG